MVLYRSECLSLTLRIIAAWRGNYSFMPGASRKGAKKPQSKPLIHPKQSGLKLSFALPQNFRAKTPSRVAATFVEQSRVLNSSSRGAAHSVAHKWAANNKEFFVSINVPCLTALNTDLLTL
jgi:hypothetical protein